MNDNPIGISKKRQLSKTRIKPKKEATFGKTPTMWNNSNKKSKSFTPKSNTNDLEKLYFKWLFSEYRGCFFPDCCNTDIEYHHLKFNETDTIHSSSASKKHNLVINVCSSHHDKGSCSFHKGKAEMAKYFTKESLTILANKLYNEFLESSFYRDYQDSLNNETEELELVFEEIL